eukprot:CAMPEP_0197247834 /NCGR_PEP_ID=MMETSP1429-20130617/32507_1 /TAXON_ID=49237 /ORGANISM="Chaetoceros  sp., Strain UNC1202" /LENGTH=151 /DNA_ID=CAMNT_0042708865 /DNA_START=117 /DNA_END=572 /DNA_ORIENTATION=-
MASRIISLFRMFSRNGQEVASGAKANSWAKIALWRRFFETQDAEEQERLESLNEILEEIYQTNAPDLIQTDEAVAAREQFIIEQRRILTRRGTTTTSTSTSTSNTVNTGYRNVPVVNVSQLRSQRQQEEERRLNEPDLDVPVGNFYVNLPQ